MRRQRGTVVIVDFLRGRGILKPARGPRLLFRPGALWDLAFDRTLCGRAVTFTPIGSKAILIRAYPPVRVLEK